MYLEHFGFQEYPFTLTPDTDFFFPYASHCAALNVLQAALRSGEGFIKVTAEVGLGKTLVCRVLLRKLQNEFVTAYVPDPHLSPRGLRVALAEELELPVDKRSTEQQVMARLRGKLLELAEAGRRVVLLIDEAQQLPAATLESVRLLTNLETEKAKLLQVVIFGQPELDRRLAGRGFRQLRQRISFACSLAPLDREATAAYLEHRVDVAGRYGGALFSDAAIETVHRASRGTPRLVNILCHKSLMAAYGRGERSVSRAHVSRAIDDTRDALPARLRSLIEHLSPRQPAPTERLAR